MSKLLISVLIDTYNHEQFIEQAITSVLEQEIAAQDMEVIVVDDGSQDGTREIVRKFEPRVRLICKVNGGQASAFNVGIPECNSEIVAFLDGDDWWAPGKLRAVLEVFGSDAAVGVVGHGITEMYEDGREHEELLREEPRFRIDSEEGARTFRLRKSFLGTSRMAFRKDILGGIGSIPESIRIQADEYLFTIGAVLSEVFVLRESYTFYRIHGGNAFQIGHGDKKALRRKQLFLEELLKGLTRKLEEYPLDGKTRRVILESIETEAELLRLSLDNGYPWETVQAELRNYRIVNQNPSLKHLILKLFSLTPALFLPSRTYYSTRQNISNNAAYRRVREKWLPFSEPKHVDRQRTSRS